MDISASEKSEETFLCVCTKFYDRNSAERLCSILVTQFVIVLSERFCVTLKVQIIRRFDCKAN